MPILHWLTRENDLQEAKQAPYCLLNPIETVGDESTSNMVIHGNNLKALKALLPVYAGQVKCVYIDPPYNTGQAMENYDDNLKHTIWLSIMYPRFELLRELLAEDGTFFCQLNDEEMAYGKVLLDEIFGRANFLNQVSVKMKQTSGASGGGEDKRLKKNIEHILIYTKNLNSFRQFNDVFDEENLFNLIATMREEGKSWKYTRIITDFGEKEFYSTIKDGAGQPIEIFKHSGVVIKTVKELMAEDGLSENDCYVKYFENVFRDTNAQSSIRTRVMEATSEDDGDFYSINYVPRSGKSKGKKTTLFYKGKNRDLIAWLRDVAVKKKKTIVKLEKAGTYWEGFPLNNLTKEGGVRFPNGKKPEALIKKVLELATEENDLILDSFLGSGTTAAVAHKMRRRYIGVELGEQAKTHCKARLKRVVDGEQGGVSKDVGWSGGGGFRFYELGDPIFDHDGKINSDVSFDQLAAHVWFSETKLPMKQTASTPFLGVHNGVAYYLLYNGILKDKRPAGGNVLTTKILKSLEPHDGPKVIYGERNMFGDSRLKAENISFKLTPYHVKGR